MDPSRPLVCPPLNIVIFIVGSRGEFWIVSASIVPFSRFAKLITGFMNHLKAMYVFPLLIRNPSYFHHLKSYTHAHTPQQVQPYLSLALQLIRTASHKVRIATHNDFESFVLDHAQALKGQKGIRGEELEGKLEFYGVGGSPKELMAYMVKSK